jgi:uncharacterized protein
MTMCVVAVVLLLALSGPLTAREVSGLSTATVSVKDRSLSERARASAVALSQVLIKLTGNRRTPGDARAQALLGRASSLLLQFAYGSAPGGGLVLKASFDQQVLSRELIARGIGTWSKQRPDTVVYLIVDDAQGHQLISSASAGTLGAALKAKAELRAVPVSLARMDEEEVAQLLTAQDPQAISDAAVTLASRYGVAAVLVGQLRESETQQWQVHWRLDVNEETVEWNQSGTLAEALVSEGVDALADALVERYAQPATLASREEITLIVQGVNSASDYGRLANYLGSLDTVAKMFLRSVDNRQVVYEITARGGRSALAQSITFGHVLAPLPDLDDTYELLP